MTPEALDALVASGATLEMIAAAWKAEMLAEPKRSTSAVRMARKRARDAEEASHSVDVTDVTSQASHSVTVTDPAPSLSSPQTPQQTHPHPRINNSRTRGTRLADDFALPEDWRDWAEAERGWSASEVADEGLAFADFWHAKPGRDGTKLDWPATWRNWVRNSRRTSPRGVRRQAEQVSLC